MRSMKGWTAVASGLAVLLLVGCSNSTAAPPGESNRGPVVIRTRPIAGIGTVLVNAQGHTVYHLTTETNAGIRCTGTCATTWPPVILRGTLPAGSKMLTGTFGTISRPDGSLQITYKGMPLYTYSRDTSAGQANGQGIQGVWFAVTPAGGSGKLATKGGGSSGVSGGVGYTSPSG